MKTWKQFGKRGFAVALSLVMCVGMIAPAFGAVEFNKDEHIDEKGFLKEAGGYYLAGDVELDHTLRIDNQEVSIDLNGYTLSLTEGAVGSVIRVENDSKLIVTDKGVEGVERGGGAGAITGGNAEKNDFGGGVDVFKSEFTMTGGEIFGNKAMNGGGIYAGSSTVELNNVIIRNNTVADKYGGGGGIGGSDSNVTVNGCTIEGNKADYLGGGIYQTGGELILNNSKVIGNTAADGGGIAALNSSNSSLNVSLNNTEVTGNSAKNGGGVHNRGDEKHSTITMNGGKISGNTATGHGGGVWNYGGAGSFIMSSGTLSNNTADNLGDDVYSCGTAQLTLADAKSMYATLDADDRDISGWYRDGIGGWDSEYSRYADVNGTADYYIKAAHDQYFMLVDGEGSELAEVEKGAEIDVSFLYPGEKDGYTFKGWTVDGEPVEGFLIVIGPVILEAQWEKDEVEQPEQPAPPVTPSVPAVPEVPGTIEDPGLTGIENETVPLAGLPLVLKPEEFLTRGKFIAILYWMDSEPAAELSTFLDVAVDHDFALAIGWAQTNDIAVGMTETEFAPDQVVTCGQLIEFLNRYAKYVGSGLFLEAEGNPNEALTWAVAEEIINNFFARLCA